MFMENGECSRRLADCNKLLCALHEYISRSFVVTHRCGDKKWLRRQDIFGSEKVHFISP